MILAPCERLFRAARYLINILYLYFYRVRLELRFDGRDLANWISHYRSGLQTRWPRPRRVLRNTSDSWLAPVREWAVSQSDLQPGKGEADQQWWRWDCSGLCELRLQLISITTFEADANCNSRLWINGGRHRWLRWWEAGIDCRLRLFINILVCRKDQKVWFVFRIIRVYWNPSSRFFTHWPLTPSVFVLWLQGNRL